MRIALFTDGIYPYVVGGMQKHSYYLAKYFSRKGVFIDLYFYEPKDLKGKIKDVFKEEELKHINFIKVNYPIKRFFRGHYIYENYLYSKYLYIELLKRPNVDFIYAQGFTGWYTILQKKKTENNLPPIGVNLHGVEMFQRAPTIYKFLERYLFRPLARYILKNTDYIFSLGGNLTVIQSSISAKQVIEAPIGIGKEWLSVTRSEELTDIKRFIFIGRYERRKGIEELNDALGELIAEKKYNFIFKFIGPIPDNKQLKSKNIHYLGVIRDEAEIQKELATSDVLVCPSYSEGMPTVILEAMACGLSVIATDVGAINKLVNSKRGWLIPPGNKSALKQAIVDVINSNNLMIKMKGSKELVSNEYNWENVIKALLDNIIIIVNSKKNPFC